MAKSKEEQTGCCIYSYDFARVRRAQFETTSVGHYTKSEALVDFFRGVLSVSPRPLFHNGQIACIGVSSFDGIADDWRAVGDDLRWAIVEFQKDAEKHGRPDAQSESIPAEIVPA